MDSYKDTHAWLIYPVYHDIVGQVSKPKKPGIASVSWWVHCMGYCLTHWGRVTHICVSDLTSICSDNSLSPARRQAIIWTNAGILLIGPWGRNFSEILIGIQIVSFKKMPLEMSSAKWRPSCLGLNELTHEQLKAGGCNKLMVSDIMTADAQVLRHQAFMI